MKYLIDTCVVSEFSKPKPSDAVLAWFAHHQAQDEFFMSSVSVGELQQGIAALTEGDSRRNRLAKWFEQMLLPAFEGRVMSYSCDVAIKWGTIMGDARRTGNVRPDLDAQIAATALTHGMTLVTRNVADFQFEGLEVVNPF